MSPVLFHSEVLACYEYTITPTTTTTMTKSSNSSKNKNKNQNQNKQLTIFIQVKVILITELLRATSEEYVIVSEEVLKAGDLVKRITNFMSVTIQSRFHEYLPKYEFKRTLASIN